MTLPTYEQVDESGTNMLSITEWVESVSFTMTDQYGKTRITLAGIEDLGTGGTDWGDVYTGNVNVFTNTNVFMGVTRFSGWIEDEDYNEKIYFYEPQAGIFDRTMVLKSGTSGLLGTQTDQQVIAFRDSANITVGVLTSGGQFRSMAPVPLADWDLCNKAYVDATSGGGDVSEAGDNEFTGANSFTQPVLGIAPATDLHLATKKYVDDNSGAGGGDVFEAGDNSFTGVNSFSQGITVQNDIILDHNGFEIRGIGASTPSIRWGATTIYGDLFISSGADANQGSVFIRPQGSLVATAQSIFSSSGAVYMPEPWTDHVPVDPDDLCNKAYVDANAGGGSGVTSINIASFIQGTVGNDELVMVFVCNEAFDLGAGLVGSRAYATTQATSAANIIIKKNGSTIGTIDFSTSSNHATFYFLATTSFATGDRLTLHGQASSDSTLADIAINLMGDLV